MTGPRSSASSTTTPRAIDAPVQTDTTVTSVRAADGGYEVVTDQGRVAVPVRGAGQRRLQRARASRRSPPGCRTGIDVGEPARVPQPRRAAPTVACWSSAPRPPASSSPTRSTRSGRPVTLSVGEHVRMPRTYRGRDISWWMDADRPARRALRRGRGASSRPAASPRRSSSAPRSDARLDLNALTDTGVQLRGRLGAIRDGMALFSGGLRNHCTLADQKLGRLLDDIDEWIAGARPRGRGRTTRPAEADAGRSRRAARPSTCTGRDPQRSCGRPASVPTSRGSTCRCSTGTGRLRHDGGVVDAPGVYFLGGTFLRRRKSSFIHGAGATTPPIWPSTSPATSPGSTRELISASCRCSRRPGSGRAAAARRRTCSRGQLGGSRRGTSSSPMLWIDS